MDRRRRRLRKTQVIIVLGQFENKELVMDPTTMQCESTVWLNTLTEFAMEIKTNRNIGIYQTGLS
jgi:hypothetical protein